MDLLDDEIRSAASMFVDQVKDLAKS